MSYLIIDLKVSKSNMIQHHKFLSSAPVFASVMAMHALDKELGGKGHGFMDVTGVGLIHRNHRPWMEQIGSTNGYLVDCLVSKRGACGLMPEPSEPKCKPRENSTQPAVHTDLEWTLIVACNKDMSGPEAVKKIRGKLGVMRLAGGVIDSARVSAVATWEEAVRARGGFWIDDASDRLTNSSDPVRSMLEPLARRPRKNGEPWFAPANMGYALLENPVSRNGSRSGLPHAFAEHLLGLVSYTPAYAKEPSEKHLWKYGWDGSQFIVTNRPGVCDILTKDPRF